LPTPDDNVIILYRERFFCNKQGDGAEEMTTLPSEAGAPEVTPPGSRADRITGIRISSSYLPLATPISDAKVLTGRQKPMTEIAMLFAEIVPSDGHEGLGFSYSKRAGGPASSRMRRRSRRRCSARTRATSPSSGTSSAGPAPRSAAAASATQAIGAFDVALWDMKAKRAGLSLAKLLGSYSGLGRCYNTSGGFLHTPIEQLLVERLGFARTRHRRHQAQGRPALTGALDIRRVEAVRKAPRRRGAADGRRQPAVGSADAQRMCRGLRALRPGLDRRAARRLRPRRAMRAGGAVRHADRHRRDADQRGRALAS
jgi:hypothetical protein